MRIELSDVVYVYQPGTPFETRALDGVDLVIEGGKFHLVTGENGSGKTTLLQILAVLSKPTSGSITIDGEDPWKDPKSFRRRMGFAFQFPEHQMFSRTVFEEISFALENFDIPDPESRVEEALRLLDLDESILDLSPFVLSGGEKRKVAIASVIAHDPELLILDEPLVSLDWVSRFELIEFLKRWKGLGKGLVVVSHHIDLFSDIADVVVEVKDGRVRLMR